MSAGLSCLKCGREATSVMETRASPEGLRRRRKCSCGHRFSTIEMPVPSRKTIKVKSLRRFDVPKNKLLAMRREGATYKQMSMALGVSLSWVWKHVNFD